MKDSALFILAFLFGALNVHTQTTELPQIRQGGGMKQLYVDGKPFVMLAGELHNSSASSIEHIRGYK